MFNPINYLSDIEFHAITLRAGGCLSMLFPMNDTLGSDLNLNSPVYLINPSAQVYFLSASKCPQLLLVPSTTVTPTLYSVLPDPFQALCHLLVFLEARCWRLSGWSMSSKMEMQTERTDWCTRVEGGEEGEGETNGESRWKYMHYHMENR